ncbi:hypothetical protein Droror1_Dr00011146 [Drosera rotundifolia]
MVNPMLIVKRRVKVVVRFLFPERPDDSSHHKTLDRPLALVTDSSRLTCPPYKSPHLAHPPHRCRISALVPMALCSATNAPISAPPPAHRRLVPFSAAASSVKLSPHIRPLSVHRCRQGEFYTRTSLRATTSEETTSDVGKYNGDKVDGVVDVDDDKPAENVTFVETVQVEQSQEGSSGNDQEQTFAEFLDKLNLQLDSGDSFSLVLYGGGALLSVWFLSAVVGAIDSIPVFPKLMEVVGLAYTLWFATRYLLFKQNRDELGAKIKEIKQQVLGSSDD